MTRRHSNSDLPALPSDDEVIEAVAQLYRETMARVEGAPYYIDPYPTAADVAYRLHIDPARRMGNGAVKGTWTGYMSPALRIAPRLRSLARRGRLHSTYDTISSRGVYRYGPKGRDAQR